MQRHQTCDRDSVVKELRLSDAFVKMKPNKFKVLNYLGNYVDERLLPNGLYFTSKPVLHSEEQTIDAMLKMYEDFHDMQYASFGIKDTICR